MCNLNTTQQLAYDTILNNKNVFLTGEAGTGKSYVLQQVMAKLDAIGIGYYVTAPTGIAALNVNGTTIHKFLSISPSENLFHAPSGEKQEAFNKLFDIHHQILIVDEISMCSSALFNYLMTAVHRAEEANDLNIQVILVGDFSQLPPVVRQGSLEQRMMKEQLGGYYAFQTQAWSDLHLTTIILKDIIRQNEADFTTALNQIRHGNADGIDYINEHNNPDVIDDAITLCGTNRTAQKINQEKLAEVDAPEFNFNAHIKGYFAKNTQPTYEKLTLKIGARVMMITNSQDPKAPYVNGSMGTVTKIIKPLNKKLKHNFNAPKRTLKSEDKPNQVHVQVELDSGDTVKVTWYSWNVYKYFNDNGHIVKQSVGTFTQLPIKLAYAITIHKSQGQTYDHVNFNPQIFADGQCYVGLSRVKTIEGLHLIKPLKDSMIKANQDVSDFYNQIETEQADLIDNKPLTVTEDQLPFN